MTDDRLVEFLNKLNDLSNDYELIVGGYQLEDEQLHLLMIKTIDAPKRRKGTPTGDIIVSYLCSDIADLLEALEQESCEDAVSRKEMLKYQQYLHGKMSNEENYKLWEFIKDLPSVTPIQPILYNIENEIKQMDFDFGNYYDDTDAIIEMVCKVIDKYKTNLPHQT